MKISVNFIPCGPIDKLSFIQAVAWCKTSNKPMPKPMKTVKIIDALFCRSEPVC